MNYSQLTQAIEDTTENTFEADQLAIFVKNAEKEIYTAVSLPAMRRNQTGTVTASNPYLAQPAQLLSVMSLAVINGSSYTYMLPKDSNFMREAYPNPTTTGIPKHYAFFDEDTFILGPTPDSAYTVEIHYSAYPESIVTASTTWLGDNFDMTLLYAALVEAAVFLQEDKDIIENYRQLYMQNLTLLKQVADGRMRRDAYRNGEFTVPKG